MASCTELDEESDEDDNKEIDVELAFSNSIRVRIEKPTEDPITEMKKELLKQTASCKIHEC